MSPDDPVAFLNLREEPAARGGNRRKWWLAAILFLVVFSVGGVGLAFLQHSLESAIWVAGGGVGLGMVLCIVCATVSFTTKEAGRFWAVLVAVPCLFLLAWAGVLFGENRIEAWKQERIARERQALVRELEADPQRGLRERWFASADSMKAQVFASSLQDPGVRYNGAQLQQICDAVPALRAQVLWNPACPAEVLTTCLPDALAEATKYSYPKLQAILRHRNTPVPLLAAIIQSPKTPTYALEQAMNELESRIPRKPQPWEADKSLVVVRIAQYSFDDDSVPSSIRYARFQRYESAAKDKYIGLKQLSLPYELGRDGRRVAVPQKTMILVAGIPQLAGKQEFQDAYVLPEEFCFDGDRATKLAMLAMGFAAEHNKALHKQRGEPELPMPVAVLAPPRDSNLASHSAPAVPPRASTQPPPRPDPYARFRAAEPSYKGVILVVLFRGHGEYAGLDGKKFIANNTVVTRMPGVPKEQQLANSKEVFGLGVYDPADEESRKLMELAEGFAREHNIQVLKERTEKAKQQRSRIY